MGDLKKKTLQGLGWSVGRLFSVQLTSFLVQLFLARLLLPEAFGLIAMLQVFVAIGQTLMDGGMTSSLIRTPNPDFRDYSTVFFINVFVAAFVYGIIFVAAEHIAIFYNQPILEKVLKIFALSIVIQSFVAVQLAKFTKDLDFKSQLMLELPSLLLSSIIAISLAFNDFGVWSLVWLHLSKSVFFAIQVWLFVKWRPSWVFDIQRLKMHFNFGYKLTLSSLLNTVYDNIYNIIIGKAFSPAQLGYYDRANSMRQLPVLTISSALNKVTYPMFAVIQNDNEKLKQTYRMLMQQILYWMAPMLVLLAVIAEPLFLMVLTAKWLPAVPYFQILCFASILYPIHAYNLNVITVKGRSDLFLKLEVAKKIIISVGIVCALPFGIYGLVYLQLINSVIGFFVNTYYSGKLIDYSTFEQVRNIAPIIFLAVGIGLLTLLASRYYITPNFQSQATRLGLASLFYGGMYFTLSILFRFSVIRDFKNLFFRR
ncbi:MAG: lipopolysaccharide biosynthesis protein [Parapedobacter sp.]|nr:MAG: lipopolysaccharide biosynthesis protein [Parapedobacter sp.]